MNKNIILIFTAVVLLVIVGVGYFLLKPVSEVPSTVTTIATSTSTTSVATSTATSTKKAPKPISPAPAWAQYLKAFSCKKIVLPANTKVNSFREEGMPVVVGTQEAYKCTNGHTWVY